MESLKFAMKDSWKNKVTFSGDEESDAEVAKKIQELIKEEEEQVAIGAGLRLWEEPSVIERSVTQEESTSVTTNTSTVHFAFQEGVTKISNLAWWYYESIDGNLYKEKPFTRTNANLSDSGHWEYTKYIPEADGFILIEPKWVESEE